MSFLVAAESTFHWLAITPGVPPDQEPVLDLMDAAQPAVVSFTFGCLPDDVVARLHTAGCAVWITVM